MKRSFQIALLSVFALLSWQCATTGGTTGKRTSEEYLKQAQVYLDQEDYLEAKSELQEARNHFRTGEVDARVLKMLGDAHFALEELDQAADAYREFLRLHPRNGMVPEVALRLGEVYLGQAKSPHRTLEPARNAREVFGRIIEGYPSSPEARDAADKMAAIDTLLAEGELVVARFYQRKKNYPGVIGRCQTVVTYYGSSPSVEEALHLLGGAHRELGNEEAAAESYRILLERFPDGKFAAAARHNLKNGKS